MSESDERQSRTQRRIDLLERFLGTLREYLDLETAPYSSTPLDQEKRARRTALRSKVNRTIVAVQHAVRDVNVSTSISIGSAMSPHRLSIDVFDNIFRETFHERHERHAIELTERALGVYQALRDDPQSVRLPSKDAIDVLEAIRRSLRPHFKGDPPASEPLVQDAVENILRALGVKFHREKERAPVGDVGYTPDFTLPDLDLAIEVKHARPTHDEKAITREISDDINAYRSKWRHVMFVVYDNGVLVDPHRLETAWPGVPVLVVKH